MSPVEAASRGAVTENGGRIMTWASKPLVGIVALALLAAGGCSVGRTAHSFSSAGKVFLLVQDLGPTLVESSGDHMHSMTAVIDQDTRAFFHDLDIFYMTDRPTRLTPWHDR